MMHFIFIIIISLMIVIFPKQGAAQSYYSQIDLDYEELISYYKDVPLHGSTDIDGFVVEIKNIEDNDRISASGITAHVTCQPFIDENGKVETIFVTKSISDYIDSLAIEALKKSKFKPLQKDGKLSRYSCIVKYYFDTGRMLCSSVNDIVINVPVKRFDELTKKPEVIRQGRIDYPVSARRAGLEGRITLMVLINPVGDVEEVEVLRGIPGLNKSAIEAAYQWKFTTGEYEGKPVKFWMQIPVDYKLKR